MPPAINLLVVGECGDGKSTLIDGLRDKSKSSQPLCGKSPQGVTKQVTVYPCGTCAGVTLNLVDTPGVGDNGVPPSDLVNKIEHALEYQDLPGGIRGILVTTPVPDGRIRLGAQVVQAIVQKGFLAVDGRDKFSNVILVGTKTDKADKDDKMNFMDGLGGNPSVRHVFFQDSAVKNPLCVMVSRQDYSPLYAAIQQLPAACIQFQRPRKEVMSQALAETLGAGIRQMQEDVQSQQKQMELLRRQALEEKSLRQQEAARQQERMRQLQIQAEERQRREREEQRRFEEEMQEATEAAACWRVLHRQECHCPRFIHPARCDGCMMDPLRGIRFRCAQCPDYDLCESCHAEMDHPHTMLPVHSGIVCDQCDRPLRGIRHMCTVCLDSDSGDSYDLCHDCFIQHGHRHKMLEVHQVKCDGCGQQPLIGKRFTCSKCPGYDLCQTCHRRGVHRHDMTMHTEGLHCSVQ